MLARILEMTDTHKNYWECEGGIAYLVSRPGLARSHDARLRPQRPGQSGEDPGVRTGRPAAGRHRRHAVAIHGLVSTGPKGNRIYLAFGTNKGGILQIVDRDKLLQGPEGADA